MYQLTVRISNLFSRPYVYVSMSILLYFIQATHVYYTTLWAIARKVNFSRKYAKNRAILSKPHKILRSKLSSTRVIAGYLHK